MLVRAAVEKDITAETALLVTPPDVVADAVFGWLFVSEKELLTVKKPQVGKVPILSVLIRMNSLESALFSAKRKPPSIIDRVTDLIFVPVGTVYSRVKSKSVVLSANCRMNTSFP